MITDQDLIRNLKAAGFEEKLVEEYLRCRREGKTEEQLQLLAAKRERILAQVHREEKQIDCLDYLVYQIGKGKVTV